MESESSYASKTSRKRYDKKSLTAVIMFGEFVRLKSCTSMTSQQSVDGRRKRTDSNQVMKMVEEEVAESGNVF
jgi:hypothetical protein